MSLIKPKDTFRKRFIAAKSDALVVETIQTYSKTKRQKLRIVTVKGTWRANENNELVFVAKARRGSAKKPDKYTFKSTWKINKNQQIEYNCGEGPDVLTFKGHWDISSANKLVYILEGSSTSRFEFRVQIESPSLYPKKGQIRYRIGIGTRKSRLSGGQLLILYGTWKIGRNLGLSFEMDYGKDGAKEIEFGASVTSGVNKFVFALENELGEPLGITLTFTHKFLEHHDAKAFIRLKSRRGERAIEGGISIPF
jgi:hypothetical protein